jgi:antitoxin VapB
VRLPKAVAFSDDVHHVDILKLGRSRVIVPQGRRWDDLFQNGPRATDDFMPEREQPPAEEREPL